MLLTPAEYPRIHAYQEYQENKCGYAQGKCPFSSTRLPPGMSVPAAVAMVVMSAMMSMAVGRGFRLYYLVFHALSQRKNCLSRKLLNDLANGGCETLGEIADAGVGRVGSFGVDISIRVSRSGRGAYVARPGDP